jgi:hypothetical protein
MFPGSYEEPQYGKIFLHISIGKVFENLFKKPLTQKSSDLLTK